MVFRYGGPKVQSYHQKVGVPREDIWGVEKNINTLGPPYLGTSH